jgi:hypothetical protein
LAKDMQQGMGLWEIMRDEIARGRRECLVQFRSITSVASVAETAELCGIKTDLSRVIELAHPFPLGFLLSAVFPSQPYAF